MQPTSRIEKIAVIGLGRVGLPFAVSLFNAGFDVRGIDANAEWVKRLNTERSFPFHEPGFDDIPQGDRWTVTDSYAELDDVDAFIVTVGTPLDVNLVPNLSPIKNVLGALTGELRKGKLLIFRSTLGLGVTKAIAKRIERSGACKSGVPNIAYCPERLAEGKAREELRTLPQIIAAEEDDTFTQCLQIFGRLAPRVHRVGLREAELIKLLCNTSRYMQFAVSNWVHEFILAQDIDPYTLLDIANDGYPRPIPDRAGFTAGTCLRKDYGLLVQDNTIGDFALAAWRVNERQPLSLLSAIKRETDISDKTVAIMGLGFKKDVDDLRDSLALKLAELIQPHCEQVFFHDPYVGEQTIELSLHPIQGRSMAAVRDDADILIVGANHSAYAKLADEIARWPARPRMIVDIWRGTGFKQTITKMEAVSADLRETPRPKLVS